MSQAKKVILIASISVIALSTFAIAYFLFFFDSPLFSFSKPQVDASVTTLKSETEISAEIVIQPSISDEEYSILQEQNTLVDTVMYEYSKGEYTIEDPFIKVNPYDFNPLSALVMFETEKPLQISYTVTGDVPYSLSIEGYKTSHEIPVICLYADRTNEVLITATDESGNETVYTYDIATDPLPDEPFTSEITVPKENDEGYIMALNLQGRSIDYVYFLDTTGEPRFYIHEGFMVNIIFTDEGTILLNPYHMTTQGLIEEYSNGIIETDYLGRIIKYYKIPFEVHHSFEVLPNNNLLIATSDESAYIEDTIIEVDRETGEIVDEWDYKEFLDMDRVARIGVHSNSGDWIHINSVLYDEETNSIFASGRQQFVISIDKDTEEINWILGEDYGYSDDDPSKEYILKSIDDDLEYPNGQHALSITDDGHLLLFDNGNMRSDENGESIPNDENYSRAVVYDIDEENMTVEQIWSYGEELGTTYYSSFISSVNQLDNGNYLVNFGAGNVNRDIEGADDVESTLIAEVSKESDTVLFEIKLDTFNYNAIPLDFKDSIEVHPHSSPVILYDEEYYPEKFETTDYFPYGLKVFVEIDPNAYGIERFTSIGNPLSVRYTAVNNDTGESFEHYIVNYTNFKSLNLEYISENDYPSGDYTFTFDLMIFDPTVETIEDAELFMPEIFVKDISF